MTADACWRSCCCHTNQQKLAWARENGVTPPDYVVVAAAKEVIVAAAKEKTSPIAKSCCSSKGSCCDANSSSATKSLPGTKIERDETTSTLVIVSVQDYQKCRGLASLWMTISHAINTSPLIAPPAKPVAGEWISSAMIDLDSISYEPAAPPPKSLAL